MRSRAPALTTTTAVLATLAGAGCHPAPGPVVAPPPQPPAMTVPQQRAAAADQYRAALARFDAPLVGLPGHTQDDHRAMAATALSALVDALRLADGTDVSPGFADDVSVVAAAAATVSNLSVPPTRMEAAENQALHAAAVGVDEIAARVLYDDAGLPPLAADAAARADAARLTQGPLHDADATAALQSLDVALHRVGDDLRDRFTPMTPPLPGPLVVPAAMATTMPDATPTTMPTTMSTMAPTTMP